MKTKRSSKNNAENKLTTIQNRSHNSKNTSATKEIIEQLNSEISTLSYEESLKALDLLLDKLQNDTVPVEDLQRNFLQGNIYLDHCEGLLDNIEQEVIELDPDNIDESFENNDGMKGKKLN